MKNIIILPDYWYLVKCQNYCQKSCLFIISLITSIVSSWELNVDFLKDVSQLYMIARILGVLFSRSEHLKTEKNGNLEKQTIWTFLATC